MSTKWIGIGLAAASLLGLASGVQAGWLQTDSDGTKTLIADGKVKDMPEEPGDGWLVMDYRNRKVLVANPEENTCSEASFEEYCQTMQEMVKEMQKAMAAFAAGQEAQSPPAVEVKKAGAGGTIAGFATTKYQVFADGELYEEVWLTTEEKLLKEVGDPASFLGLEQCMGGMDSEVEGNPDYVDMITSGLPLKSISYEYGQAEVDTETVSLESKDILPSEFKLPAGCRRVSLQENLGGL